MLLLSQHEQCLNTNPSSQLLGYLQRGEKGVLEAASFPYRTRSCPSSGRLIQFWLQPPDTDLWIHDGLFWYSSLLIFLWAPQSGWRRSSRRLTNLLPRIKAGFSLLFFCLIETWKLLKSLAEEKLQPFSWSIGGTKSHSDWCDGKSLAFSSHPNRTRSERTLNKVRFIREDIVTCIAKVIRLRKGQEIHLKCFLLLFRRALKMASGNVNLKS